MFKANSASQDVSTKPQNKTKEDKPIKMRGFNLASSRPSFMYSLDDKYLTEDLERRKEQLSLSHPIIPQESSSTLEQSAQYQDALQQHKTAVEEGKSFLEYGIEKANKGIKASTGW